jgi:hypothetical protein
MKCSRCGIDLLDGSNFCHICGTSVKIEGDVADSVSDEIVFKAKDATTLVWQPGESGAKIKLAASDLSASHGKEEHKVHSIEDLVHLIRGRPSSRSVDDVSNEVIFHIFTAWR